MLVGARYIQDQDPGVPPSTGYDWFKPSTDELLTRNQSNTGWVVVGTSASDRLGMLPTSGGSMVGAMLGGTNLVPNDSPDLVGTPTRDSKALATMADVKRVQKSIREDFTIIAKGAVNGSTGGASASDKIKFTMGESALTYHDLTSGGILSYPLAPIQTHYATVPLPSGMAEADCVWIPCFSFGTVYEGGSGSSVGWQIITTVPAKEIDSTLGNRDYIAAVLHGDPNTGNYTNGHQGKFRYLCIGVQW